MKTKQTKIKRGVLICLLLLADLIVANVVYNFWVAERGTPIWASLTSNVVWDLWTARKKPVKKPAKKPGVVTGILYDVEKPCAVVGGETVNEGDVVKGIKVVKIHRGEVEFEKNGEVWRQLLGGQPNPAWMDE